MNSRPGQTMMESVNTLAPARVEWRNISMANGKAVPQTTRMSAKQMNLKFDAQNQLQQLVSTGGVEVTRKLGDAPEQTTTSRELTVKFAGSSPNNSRETAEWTTIDQTGDVRFHDGQRTGQGDRAHADHAANTVTLDGSVILTDAQTRTTAQTATFVQGSNTLRADGRVLSTELGAGTAAAGSTGTTEARAEFQISVRSPHTSRRTTSWPTQREGTLCTPEAAGCGKDNRKSRPTQSNWTARRKCW